ncbi:DJ-1/PfpI family protein [Bacillus sp. CGMCC 1.16607]|uniref:DJ-1/PfpI family protein n=1 Tax=Bacillus sp. CGMCC 1.16607 TaxID=3351842 RepID=UPI00364058E1
MKIIIQRILVYSTCFILFFGGVGWLGYNRSLEDFDETYSSYDDTNISINQDKVKIPMYNPEKPTAVVLLGEPITEVLDFLVPYEMLAMTGAYNVYAIAPKNKVMSITGGLEIIPHYSYDEIDRLLLGKSPDVIVAPAIRITDEKKYKPTRKWIQKHSKSEYTKFISICNGAKNLADAGLLDGKSAATHWQVISSMAKKFPKVEWIKDQRYVEDGNIISSAGLSAGIDAMLHLISQELGRGIALDIAQKMNYPSLHFLKNPKMDPYFRDIHFITTFVFNIAYQWNKEEVGVLLYDDMEEMALSSIFDTYSDTGTTRTFTIASTENPIVTKHQLNLIARHKISDTPKLDKMIVSGTRAKSLVKDTVKNWETKNKSSDVLFVHSDSPNRYIFEAPIEDLAKQEDRWTARYAIKRLEYRANNIHLEGKPFPYETYFNLFLTCFLSILVAFVIDRKCIAKKNKSKRGLERLKF